MMSTLFSLAKRRRHVRQRGSLCTTIIYAVLFACGIAAFHPMPATAQPSQDEGAVRQAFASLQAAVKTQNADKLWDLLSTKSRADAERIAKTLREAYDK